MESECEYSSPSVNGTTGYNSYTSKYEFVSYISAIQLHFATKCTKSVALNSG